MHDIVKKQRKRILVTPSTIVKQLRAIRKERRITQDALASKVGYAKNSLAESEIGKRNPRFDMVMHWAEALGYDIVLKERST
jgi:transcriptional regulator with XRE-family HTH domain